jgi:hypothetical protein
MVESPLLYGSIIMRVENRETSFSTDSLLWILSVARLGLVALDNLFPLFSSVTKLPAPLALASFGIGTPTILLDDGQETGKAND